MPNKSRTGFLQQKVPEAISLPPPFLLFHPRQSLRSRASHDHGAATGCRSNQNSANRMVWDQSNSLKSLVHRARRLENSSRERPFPSEFLQISTGLHGSPTVLLIIGPSPHHHMASPSLIGMRL